MSLFQSNRVTVVLTPGGFGLIAPQSTQVFECEVHPQATGHPDMPAIQAALIAAIKAIPGRRFQLHFVLSGALLRFAELPWSPVYLQEDEQETLLRTRLGERYGDMAGWSISLAKAQFGRSRIGCGLREDWLALITQVATASAAKLASVQPYFLSSWNQWCRLPSALEPEQANSTIFTVIENGSMVSARVDAEGLQEVHTQRIEFAPEADLVDVIALHLDRLRWGLGGGDIRSIYLHVPGWDEPLRRAVAEYSNVPIVWVEPCAERQSARHHMLKVAQPW